MKKISILFVIMFLLICSSCNKKTTISIVKETLKDEYYLEDFDLSSIMINIKQGKSTSNVNLSKDYIKDYNPKLGVNTFTVEYNNATTSFTTTLKEKIKDISISNDDLNKEYYIDEFDLSLLTLNYIYGDIQGSVKLSNDIVANFTKKLGINKFTVTYLGISKEFQVTLIKKEPVINLYVDENSINGKYYIDEFNPLDIILEVSIDSVKKYVEITPEMLSYEKFVEGVNNITIKYMNKEITISVNLYEKEFYTDGLLFNKSLDGTYYIVVGYNGLSSKVIIPSTYKFLPVEEIKQSSFEENEYIEEVVLPNTIRIIGEKAFNMCSNLKYINIPESVEKISNLAFYESLIRQTIYIPKSVKSIGYQAFYNVLAFVTNAKQNLNTWNKEITNDKKTKMYYGVERDDLYLSISDSLEYILSTDYATLINIRNECSNVVIPSIICGKKLSIIGDYAFLDHTELTSVVFGDNIEVIGNSSFGNTSIQEVYLPNSVKEIKSYAFSSCVALKTIHLNEGLEYIYNCVFSANSMLEEVILPSSLILLDDYAFQNCYNVKAIYIKNNTTYVGESCFYACHKLTIYYEGSSIPSSWHTSYNPNKRPVVLNTTK